MTTELTYLTLVTLLTGLMWIPYIFNLIAVRGLLDAVGYPENPLPMAAWALRLKAAHYNAVENLVIFAVLVLVVQVSGSNSGATATACVVYFWTRIVHALSYALAIPWVRTLAFGVGVFCQLTLAWQLLA